MSQRPREIEIRNWEKFQHYKKRNPPWIRLYRDLVDDAGWRSLSDGAARLLVELWVLASEMSPGGRVPMDLNLLAWRTGRASTDASMSTSLQELADKRFIVMPDDASTDASTFASTSTRQRQSTETETETEKNTARGFETNPEYTKGELLAAARKQCGLGLWDRGEEGRANSVLVSFYGEGKKPEIIWAAIHGSRILADSGKVEWLPAGKPFGLRALRNTCTLYDQGDGRCQRPLFDVAVEAYYADGDGKRKGAGGMASMADVLKTLGAA